MRNQTIIAAHGPFSGYHRPQFLGDSWRHTDTRRCYYHVDSAALDALSVICIQSYQSIGFDHIVTTIADFSTSYWLRMFLLGSSLHILKRSNPLQRHDVTPELATLSHSNQCGMRT